MCQVKVNLCAHVLLNAQRMLDGLNIPAIALSHSSPLWLSVRLLKQLKQLKQVEMAAVALLMLAAAAAAMKTHDLTNQSDAAAKLIARRNNMTCREMNRQRVDGMKDDLDQSHGFDAMFYRGCLKFVKANGDGKHGAAEQTEKLGAACKKGTFDGKNSVLTKAWLLVPPMNPNSLGHAS